MIRVLKRYTPNIGAKIYQFFPGNDICLPERLGLDWDEIGTEISARIYGYHEMGLGKTLG